MAIGVLETMNFSPQLQLPAHKMVGRRIVYIGKSGSGKTNGQRVAAEEYIRFMPLIIFDPQSNFRQMVDHYPILLASNAKKGHVPLNFTTAATLGEMAFEKRISILIDLPTLDAHEWSTVIGQFLEAFWTRMTRQDVDDQMLPFAMIVDEAKLMMGRKDKTDAGAIFADMAARGRHYNLAMILASQRATHFDPDILNQSNMVVIGKVTGTDLQYLAGDTVSLSAKDLRTVMRPFHPGDALVVGDADIVVLDDGSDAEHIVTHIRASYSDTRLAADRGRIALTGSNPLPETIVGNFRSEVDERAADATISEDKTDDPAALKLVIAQKSKRIEELEAELAEARAYGERLADEIATYPNLAYMGLAALPMPKPDENGEYTMQGLNWLIRNGTLVDGHTPNNILPGDWTIIDEVPREMAGDDWHQIVNIEAQRQSDIVYQGPPRPVVVEDDPNYRTDLQATRARNQQQRGFDKLLGRITALKNPTQAALYFLMTQNGGSYYARHIAIATGYSVETMERWLGNRLVEMGLAEKDEFGAQYSVTATYLTKTFPDLDITTMLNAIYDAIKNTLRL